MRFLPLFFTALILFMICTPSYAQLTVTPGPNLSEILQKLVGDGVTITNITTPNNPQAYGSYTNTDVTLGITKGLILSTGRAIEAIGPNNRTNNTTDWGLPGDATLNSKFSIASQDACVIEFKVIPKGTEIRFKYTFASEEYPEFTDPSCNVGTNDVFAFFVNGPNPMGGSYINENIAVVPSTVIPVSIRTINPFPCGNNIYYQDNGGGTTLQYDGYTKNLVAIIKTIPCQEYTFKLAIADVGDGTFDSAVFIEDINSNTPEFNASLNSPVNNLVEGCVNATVDVSRSGDVSNPADFDLTYEGTAVLNTDYNVSLANPFELNYGAGVNNISFTLNGISDGMSEGNETIIIYVKPKCGGLPIDTLSFTLIDRSQIDPILNLSGTTYFCGTSPVILTATDGNSYNWSSPDGGSVSCPTCKTTQVLNNNATYRLDVTIGACVETETVVVASAVMPPNISASKTTLCEGETINISTSGRSTYAWTSNPPDLLMSCTNCPNPDISPLQTTTYTVVGTQGNCNDTRNITITVVKKRNPQFSNLKDNYCINDAPITLTASLGPGTFLIDGNPATVLNPAILGTGMHIVRYLLDNGSGCIEEIQKNVRVNALPNPQILISNLEYCANDAAVPLTGQPAGGTFTIQGNQVSVFNPALYLPGNYTVIYRYIDPLTLCENISSVNLRVKPIPNLSFNNVRNNYCVNEAPQNIEVNISGAQTSVNGLNNNQINPAVLGVGQHTISSSYTDPLTNCSNTIQRMIRVHALTPLNFVNLRNSYCKEANDFTLQVNPAGGTLFIDNINNNGLLVRVSMLTIGNHIFRYVFTDVNGCTNQITQTVNIDSNPQFVSRTDSLMICPDIRGSQVDAEINGVVPNPSEVSIYSWSNGASGRFLDITSTGDTGTYVVTVTDGLGCPRLRRTFYIRINCEPAFFVPTAFSPNGDGANDKLEIFGGDFYKLDFRVFNRWGEVVFIGNEKEALWDGTLSGKPLPSGAYLWKATFENILKPGDKLQKQGKVTLIR